MLQNLFSEDNIKKLQQVDWENSSEEEIIHLYSENMKFMPLEILKKYIQIIKEKLKEGDPYTMELIGSTKPRKIVKTKKEETEFEKALKTAMIPKKEQAEPILKINIPFGGKDEIVPKVIEISNVSADKKYEIIKIDDSYYEVEIKNPENKSFLYKCPE